MLADIAMGAAIATVATTATPPRTIDPPTNRTTPIITAIITVCITFLSPLDGSLRSFHESPAWKSGDVTAI